MSDMSIWVDLFHISKAAKVRTPAAIQFSTALYKDVNFAGNLAATLHSTSVRWQKPSGNSTCYMEWEVNGKILTRFISDWNFIVIPCFEVYLLFFGTLDRWIPPSGFSLLVLYCGVGVDFWITSSKILVHFMNTVHHFGALIFSQHGAQE